MLVIKNPPANAGDIRNVGLIPGSGRCPGGGHGNPSQYCCLENHIKRGVWLDHQKNPMAALQIDISERGYLVSIK